MFARWGQENFFKYMMQEFGIDTLVSYLKVKIPLTTELINPQYRAVENLRKKATSKLNSIKAKFATLTLNQESVEDKKMERYMLKKEELKEAIEEKEIELEEIKQQKKQIPRKITYKELPQNEMFDNVINQRKHFLDIVKLISYRAETSLANIIRKNMGHADEARILLKQIYKTDADLIVDNQNQRLIVQIHKLAHRKDDVVLQELCDILNSSQTLFPDSNLTLFYKLGSA